VQGNYASNYLEHSNEGRRRDDVLAFLHFPEVDWCNAWSTNSLEGMHKEMKRHALVSSIFPNVLEIVRLMSKQLSEQQE
jgi:transposase-like protein